jgi:hypothetical protein
VEPGRDENEKYKDRLRADGSAITYSRETQRQTHAETGTEPRIIVACATPDRHTIFVEEIVSLARLLVSKDGRNNLCETS